MKRTTLELNNGVLDAAMAYGEGMTKTQVINEALRAFVQRRRQREILEFFGRFEWQGDLDALRERTTGDDR